MRPSYLGGSKWGRPFLSYWEDDRLILTIKEVVSMPELEKEKARRYSSAAQLAADIGRFLHDEPIVARPLSTTYRISKFARRHKLLVASTAIIFLVLVAGQLPCSRRHLTSFRCVERFSPFSSHS